MFFKKSDLFEKLFLTWTILGLSGAMAQAGTINSLSDLKGLESKSQRGYSHEKRDNSPSQVVILNNTPRHNQQLDSQQNLNQFQNQRQGVQVRQGWGTGGSLEAVREWRMRQEAKNEQALMEKLEESRLRDEKSRLNRLFKIREYNKSREHYENNAHIDGQYHHPQKVYPKYLDPDPVSSEEHYLESKSESMKREVKIKKTRKPHYSTKYQGGGYSWWRTEPGTLFVKGQVGLGDYAQADNSKSVSSWGLSLGKNLSHNLSVELGFFKSRYEIDDPNASLDYYNLSQFRRLDQYNVTGLVGYKILQTSYLFASLRGGVSYVNRKSDSLNSPCCEVVKSESVDGMLGLGADFALSKRLSLVAHLDYYRNIASNVQDQSHLGAKRVEHADYFILGAGLKLNF